MKCPAMVLECPRDCPLRDHCEARENADSKLIRPDDLEQTLFDDLEKQ